MKTFEEFLKQYKEILNTDPTLQRQWEKAVNGTATWEDARSYAVNATASWNKLMNDSLGEGASINLAESWEEIRPSIEKVYSDTAYYSKNVMKITNKNAGIGMKPLEPALDEERLSNLYKRVEEVVSNNPDKIIADVITADVVENIAQTAVVDTIHANARIQSKAGLKATIERHGGAGCCSWCASVSGKYDYGDEPDDFYRVHKGCTCHFVYKPSKGMVENFNYITKDGKMTKVVK